MKRMHVIMKGKVQGVNFRNFIKENAEKLNLKGWVKNKRNYIETVFEGDVGNVHKMLILCKKGPKGSSVDDLNSSDERVKNEKTFKILK
ncbi:MAG: acylphosphatase [Nanoarchaeota archaeon]|nr:acylphosphatase [Nanoarchaeota archaeon]